MNLDTYRAAADELLSEGRYRRLVELSPNPICIQIDGRFAFVNTAALQLFGAKDPGQMVGRPVLDFVHPDFRDRVAQRIRALQLQEAPVPLLEQAILRLDGSAIEVEVAAFPLPCSRLPAVQIILRDITERKRAEASWRDSEERFRQLAETIECVFWMANGELTQMLYVSPAYEKIWGRTCASLYQNPHSFLEAVHPEDRPWVQQSLRQKQLGQAEHFEIEYRLVRPDGAIRWIKDRGFPVRDAEGRLYRMAGIAEDITRRRELEAQLRQAQKLEAIGTLAGGIAHDFNNILGAIIGFTSLARMDAESHPGICDSLNQVLQACDRAKQLVSQILTFSRQQKQQRRPLQLQPVIEEALQLLRSTLPATIELVTRLDPMAPLVLADATQIHQVLMNLCTNAAHAIGVRPGRLELELAPCQVTAQSPALSADLCPGLYARLTVADTGQGMDAATLSRIFEPFFSTKPQWQGTGLGLAVVHGILQEHQGAIRVRSQPGCGTTFELYFPACQTPTATPERLPSQPPRGQGEHILLVDDEPALVLSQAQILQRLGYRVTTETDPLQALQRFRDAPQQFQLLISDLTMPKMTGVDLALQVLQTHPQTPILLATGFGSTWNAEALRLLGIRDLLLKPFSPATLAQAVQNALYDTQSNHPASAPSPAGR